MRNNRGGWVLCAAWLGVLGAASFAGCTPSASSLCDEMCECVACTGAERDNCVDEIEDAQRDADDKDCSAEWDAVVTCMHEETYDLGCDSSLHPPQPRLFFNICNSELYDLAHCTGGGVSIGGFFSSCTMLEDRCSDCVGSAFEEECQAMAGLVEEAGGNDACQEQLDTTGGSSCPNEGPSQ